MVAARNSGGISGNRVAGEVAGIALICVFSGISGGRIRPVGSCYRLPDNPKSPRRQGGVPHRGRSRCLSPTRPKAHGPAKGHEGHRRHASQPFNPPPGGSVGTARWTPETVRTVLVTEVPPGAGQHRQQVRTCLPAEPPLSRPWRAIEFDSLSQSAQGATAVSHRNAYLPGEYVLVRCCRKAEVVLMPGRVRSVHPTFARVDLGGPSPRRVALDRLRPMERA